MSTTPHGFVHDSTGSERVALRAAATARRGSARGRAPAARVRRGKGTVGGREEWRLQARADAKVSMR